MAPIAPAAARSSESFSNVAVTVTSAPHGTGPDGVAARSVGFTTAA